MTSSDVINLWLEGLFLIGRARELGFDEARLTRSERKLTAGCAEMLRLLDAAESLQVTS